MDEAAILSAALALAADGYSVIPVHAVRLDEQGGAHCTCGKPACSNIGKHPAISWAHWQQNRASDAQIKAWFGPGQPYAGYNIGVVTGRFRAASWWTWIVAPGSKAPKHWAHSNFVMRTSLRPSAHAPEAVVNTCSFAIQVCRSGARRTHSASMWTCAAKAASSWLLHRGTRAAPATLEEQSEQHRAGGSAGMAHRVRHRSLSGSSLWRKQRRRDPPEPEGKVFDGADTYALRIVSASSSPSLMGTCAGSNRPEEVFADAWRTYERARRPSSHRRPR